MEAKPKGKYLSKREMREAGLKEDTTTNRAGIRSSPR